MAEFGSGYATCLRLFANHRGFNDFRDLGLDAERMKLYPMLWFNGASDHLYGLKIPRSLNHHDRAFARALQADALELGHGFTRDATWGDVDEDLALADQLLANLTERGFDVSTVSAAMAADIELGLRPDWGETARCDVGERDADQA